MLASLLNTPGPHSPVLPGDRERRGRHNTLRLTMRACALSVVFCPVLAHAHLGHVVQQAERYIKLDASGYHVRIVVSLTLGARETSRVMQQADTDQNGWVSPEERDAYMALWGDGLREELRIQVDGEPMDVVYGEAFMQPIGPVAAVDGAVEMVGTFVLDGGEHHITVTDGMPLDPFDRTDLSFRARDGSSLLSSGIGLSPSAPLEHGSIHRDTPYPGVFSMRVHVPRRPPTLSERLRSFAPWGGVGIVGLGCGWLWLRRRAAAKRRS